MMGDDVAHHHGGSSVMQQMGGPGSSVRLSNVACKTQVISEELAWSRWGVGQDSYYTVRSSCDGGKPLFRG